MASVVLVYANKRILFVCFLLIQSIATSVCNANPWRGSLGDARAVQRKTEDIEERLKKSFPYSPATAVASQLDNAACQLLESIKCGHSCAQVQAALQQTCLFAEQVSAVIASDPCVCHDRRLHDYVVELAKRIERLHCSLEKAYAKNHYRLSEGETFTYFFNANIRPPLMPRMCIRSSTD